MTTDKLRFPFTVFFGTSFHNAKQIPTKDGYRLEEISPNRLNWKYYIHRMGRFVVQAYQAECDLRIQAYPNDVTASAVMEVSSGMMLVHDSRTIWFETPTQFIRNYAKVDSDKAVITDSIDELETAMTRLNRVNAGDSNLLLVNAMDRIEVAISDLKSLL